MRKILCLIFAALLLFSLCSCKDKSGLKNVSTGITAEVDTSAENFYGFDHLIINGEKYVLITDENRNLKHAGKNAEALSPFANFGEKNDSTMYEIKSDSPVKVYTDSKNRALFCKEAELEEFSCYYDDYNNYKFTVSVDQSTKENVTFDKDLINNIISLKDSEDSFEAITVKSSDIFRLLPLSNDGVMEKSFIYLAHYNGSLYLYLPAYINDKGVNAVKIDPETAAAADKILKTE